MMIKAEAWSTTFAILQDASTSVEGKMFAATVLKGKVRFEGLFSSKAGTDMADKNGLFPIAGRFPYAIARLSSRAATNIQQRPKTHPDTAVSRSG